MLAILEQYITAKQLVAIGQRQIEEAKLILQTSTDSKIKSKCNYIITEFKELDKLINAKLRKLRPDIEEYLTIDFTNLNKDINVGEV